MTSIMPDFRFLLSVLLISGLAALSGNLGAQEKLTLEKIVEEMDKTISGYGDQILKITMNIYDVDGSKKSYDFDTYQKGKTKRLLRFKSGEMKGMSTLILDRDNVWIYLPGYKRIRRVAAGNMKQSMAGSDFSNEDMTIGNWAKVWDIVMDKEDDEFWYMKATLKKGQNSAYATAYLQVYKKNFLQHHVDYFNEKGEKVKIWYQKNLHDFGSGQMRNQIVGMKDPRTGHYTELFVHEITVNQGLKDSLFTKRNLQWGR